MEPAFSHCGEERWELASRPCRGDAPVRRILGQQQFLDTVRTHGGVTSGDVQLSGVYLRDVGQQRDCGDAILGDERGQVPKECCITEVGQRVVVHDTSFTGRVLEIAWITTRLAGGASLVPRPISAQGEAPGARCGERGSKNPPWRRIVREMPSRPFWWGE